MLTKLKVGYVRAEEDDLDFDGMAIASSFLSPSPCLPNLSPWRLCDRGCTYTLLKDDKPKKSKEPRLSCNIGRTIAASGWMVMILDREKGRREGMERRDLIPVAVKYPHYGMLWMSCAQQCRYQCGACLGSGALNMPR